MNENLIREAVWCYNMSSSEKYGENYTNAHRYHISLYELIRVMTKDELSEYNIRIKTL